MAYVIKRYSNRKLYDTQESRYVTLEEIEEMIRGGREISVVDAASGEDLTSVTLTQIILENERNHRANLPSAFLHQLIKHGEAWQEFVQRTMRSSLEGFVSSQRDMERVFREWSSRSGWGTAATGGAGTTEPAKRDGATDADADKLREEVSALRDRLRSLEERLQKRKADGK
jgi:polyhydroxyalkanoate synthesis repressor PhaR